jgi:hypothetical protein
MAAPSSESDLIPWAERISPGALRRKADLVLAPGKERTSGPETTMSFDWWHADEERTRVAFQGEMPAVEATVITGAVEGPHGAGPPCSPARTRPIRR